MNSRNNNNLNNTSYAAGIVPRNDNNRPFTKQFTITISSDNCINTSAPNPPLAQSAKGQGKNSRYVYEFSNTVGLDTQTSAISIQSVSIPFSWRNITASYGNNTFSYTFNGLTRTLIIPDGFYGTNSLYAWLQGVMVTCGDYLISTNGSYIYFIEFVSNTPLYRVQFNSYSLALSGTSSPYTSPTGYTVPSTFGSSVNNSYITTTGTATFTYVSPTTLSTSNSGSGQYLGAGYLTIPNPANTSFTLWEFFGLYTGTPNPQIPYAAYNAPSNANVSQLGDISPHNSNVDCLVLSSPQVKNLYTSTIGNLGTTVIASIQINSSYGNNIVLDQFFTTWLPFRTDQLKKLEIYLTDQDGNDVFIEDYSGIFCLMFTNAQ